MSQTNGANGVSGALLVPPFMPPIEVVDLMPGQTPSELFDAVDLIGSEGWPQPAGQGWPGQQPMGDIVGDDGWEYEDGGGDDDVQGGDFDSAEDNVMGQVLGDVLGDQGGGFDDGYEYEEVVGARGRRRRRRKKRRWRAQPRMIVPGVQRPGERKQFLPLGQVLFQNAGPTTLSPVAVNCQRPFRGTRLIIARANVGAGAPALGVTLSDFRIANTPQPAVAGETPIEAFQAQAFDLALDLDSSQPGVTYLLTFTITAAPAVAETVQVTSALFGKSLTG